MFGSMAIGIGFRVLVDENKVKLWPIIIIAFEKIYKWTDKQYSVNSLHDREVSSSNQDKMEGEAVSRTG